VALGAALGDLEEAWPQLAAAMADSLAPP
jgi:hypothetical protein